jgi:hypothetical protein
MMFGAPPLGGRSGVKSGSREDGRQVYINICWRALEFGTLIKKEGSGLINDLGDLHGATHVPGMRVPQFMRSASGVDYK